MLGTESGPDFTPLPISTTLIVSNAALQRDAARHVRVMSVLFKAGELERPIYAYAFSVSFSASWFSSPCASLPCDCPLFILSPIRVQPTNKRRQFQQRKVLGRGAFPSRSSASSITSTSGADHLLTLGADHSLRLFFFAARLRLILVFFAFRFLAMLLPLISPLPLSQFTHQPSRNVWLPHKSAIVLLTTF
jgi:hypothetical protein